MARVPVMLPDLGNGVEEAQVDAWMKVVGDAVTEGETLVVVTTPKVTLDIEAPVSGVLVEVLAEEDSIIDPATALGTIETD